MPSRLPSLTLAAMFSMMADLRTWYGISVITIRSSSTNARARRVSLPSPVS